MEGAAGQVPCVVGVGDVPDFDPHSRHPGQAQQIPGTRVRVAVQPIGPGSQLVLHAFSKHFSCAGMQTAARVPVVESGDPVRGRTLGAIHVDADRDIGPNSVRELCALRLTGVDPARRTGEQRLGAESGKATFDSNRDGVADVRFNGAPRIDNDHFVGNPGLEVSELHVFAEFGSVTADNGANQSIEGTESLWSAGSIGNYAHACLKFPERVIGVGTEDAVWATGVEAKFR